MELIASIGLDVAAVAMVGYCGYAAAKKGFLRTVVQMIAYVAIVLLASFFSRTAAPIVYDRFVEPMLMGQESPAPQGDAAFLSVGMLSYGQGSLDMIEDFLPELADGFDTEGLVEDIADATLRPLMVSAISMLGFVLIFTLLSIAANMLLSTLGIINHLPVIGAFNAALGCVVGILQGLLLVWVLGILLRGVLHIYPEGWWVFTPQVLENTFVFKYFADPSLLRQLPQLPI